MSVQFLTGNRTQRMFVVVTRKGDKTMYLLINLTLFINKIVNVTH
jgi:hypothetical protein